jgi:hypothetical protein
MEHYNGFEMKNNDRAVSSASISDEAKNSIDDLPGTGTEIASAYTQDQKDMQRVGKKQEFRVWTVL